MGDTKIGVPGEAAKLEVNSVVTSAVFARSPRLARLLSYLCTKYFEGEADQLKEYSIAVEVLDRPESFDPAQDAIARVEVHRLRKKLREYYETEGADHALRIEIPSGRYAPVFLPAASPGPELHEAQNGSSRKADGGQARAVWWRFGPGLLAVLTLGSILIFSFRTRPASPLRPLSSVSAASVNELPGATLSPAGPPPGDEVRILCGRRAPYTDRLGRVWGADREFAGGNYADGEPESLYRTFDPALFRGARVGNFTYNIPLRPGVYELHLYFADFGPPNSGGENTRVFHVVVNNRRLLSDFDIAADAGGMNIADERVFKNISPGSDGVLHLRFMSVRSEAALSAIVLEPAWPRRLNPVRIYAGAKPYVDSIKRTWLPEDFLSGGQAGTPSAAVEGTRDQGLYASERYGNFSYAIPVDDGDYRLTLQFAETYWGRENPGGGGPGTRAFDVFCNGTALIRDLDIYKEAGGDRALVKTFHGLRPNAQGKLMLSFVPVRNYASVFAIEVADESPD